ncbi:MAG: hypothetical protein A2Y33_00790 [Spirochaetes bacterium GWF1_51_8]|nr:MAG: hypothetical protein A2Y33_00790 [Spirochaetes bacterium GWF1_51_8]
MIKTQIIKEDEKPVAVVLDYEEYKRLLSIEQDKDDIASADKVKRQNKKWTAHSDLKKELGI